MHCEIDGPDSGRPLLCLHSLATDMTVWDAQVPAFTATGFRVVRVDLRGHGGTTATPPPYTLDLLVADAVAVLDALDIGRCSVLGLSLGGMIAMGLALDHPERVDKLVVADARADAPPPYVALWDGIIERAHAEGMAAVVDASIQRWFTPAFVEQRPPALERLRAAATRTTIEGLEGCGRALQQLAYLPRLHAITAPTLFVTGEHDGPAPPEVMQEMAAAVPTAGELVVIPHAGHLSAVEQPEAFTAAVTAFL